MPYYLALRFGLRCAVPTSISHVCVAYALALRCMCSVLVSSTPAGSVLDVQCVWYAGTVQAAPTTASA
eukprot:3057067-Rhodomonas_salina.4